MTSVAAIIICFHPDHERLAALITTIAKSVDEIILFDNGGLDSTALSAVGVPFRVESRGSQNLGMATALNLACEVASQGECRYAITFDQDSTPDKAMILQLLAELQIWQGRGEKVAAIGPQVVDVRDGSERKSPFLWISPYRCRQVTGHGTLPVSLLITSGCLFDLNVWKTGARFDDKLFIDLVDHNWCWRLAASGYTVLGTTKVKMIHELSSGLKRAGRATLTMYGPVRRYFQCRNATYHLLYEPFSLGKMRFLVRSTVLTVASAAFADRAPWGSLWQCLRGTVHGACRMMGPFRP